MKKLTEKEQKRFWNNMEFTDGGHWLWKRKKDPSHSYGMFYYRNKSIPANKIAWELEGNDKLKPKQLLVSHCDVKSCCNPEHQFITDKQALMSLSIGRGQENHNAKLTNEIVKYIRENKESLNEETLAKKFNCSQPLISYVINNKIWKNI